ncbi:MAG: hypothetical protein ACYC9Q_07955 [Bacillota bacterium]
MAVIGGDEPRVFIERLSNQAGAAPESQPGAGPAGLVAAAGAAALTAFRALGCGDYAEVRVVAPPEGGVLVESVDPLPCLDPRRSPFVRAVTSSGLTLAAAIALIFEAAGERYGRRTAVRARA